MMRNRPIEEIKLQREKNLMADIPSVYIIILNWNGWHDTLECLTSIRDLTYQNYRVVVVDNGSEDDSCQRMRDWAKDKNGASKNETTSDTAAQVVEYNKTVAEAGGKPPEEKLLFGLPQTRSLVLIGTWRTTQENSATTVHMALA